LNSRTAIIVLMATQYQIVNSSMSKVEFHHVDTSCGIIQEGRPWADKALYHAGRRIVVEFCKCNIT